jgi:hypothetical protein
MIFLTIAQGTGLRDCRKTLLPRADQPGNGAAEPNRQTPAQNGRVGEWKGCLWLGNLNSRQFKTFLKIKNQAAFLSSEIARPGCFLIP